MASRFVLTPRAVADLDAIWSYIAEDNPEAADRVEAAILAACSGLARHPLMGTRRREITELPVRFWAVTRFPNFVVVYRPEFRPLQVIAVLHGKRNLPLLLAGPES